MKNIFNSYFYYSIIFAK